MRVVSPVSVVMARVVHVRALIDGDGVIPFDVSVVIICHEILIGHELIRGSCAPQLIHGLHVQIVVSCDAQSRLCIANRLAGVSNPIFIGLPRHTL